MRAYLKEKGVLDDTLVVYTSDQGFFLGDHGLYDKRFMMEEVIKMPFIVSCPSLIRPGTVNDDIVTNIDFAPTFLEIADAPKPDQMQGSSFLGNLEGRTPVDWRKDCYLRYYVEGGEHATAAWYGVRTRTDKLMFYYKRGEWEYFDLVKDPEELENGYSNPAYEERIAFLKTRLGELRAELGDDDRYKDAKEYGPLGD
jgi:arylsulfatase A-like enzyme